MLKRLLPLLFLVPVLAHADCGIASTVDGMAIVVGKSGGGCLSGAAFREAFIAELQSAMVDDTPAARARRSTGDRAPSGGHRWALEVRRFPPAQPGGRYYGQH